MSEKLKKEIVIIGAGPAGLTAAFELSKTEKYTIKIVEASEHIGGISKTINYKGNLIDIGGHRFFSKSEKVLKWWTSFLPIIDTTNTEIEITYHNKKINLKNVLEEEAKMALMVRSRKSRIYFSKRFFDYPLQANYALIKNLGKKRSLRIARDLLKAKLSPIKPELTLEDFYINRFGKELYKTFFKDYTKKVWGKECKDISNDWGKQRIKTLGIITIIWHSLRKVLFSKIPLGKNVNRSLTEKFLYPSKGPGMMWEAVAAECEKNGVELIKNALVSKIRHENKLVVGVEYIFEGKTKTLLCDAIFSTMPIKNLMNSMSPSPKKEPLKIANDLEYRDFIIVGLLLDSLLFEFEDGEFIKDNWIYIQDKGVNVGRLQIFNNWSPFMTKDDKYWIGAEYFANEKDELWNLTDQELIELSLKELAQLGILNPKKHIDSCVVRCPKAYPSYTGAYKDINQIENYLDDVTNLFTIGRNGLHKYNNQDHSMLTAFKAVELFENNVASKSEIWKINSDEEYHEEVKTKKRNSTF